MLPIITTRGSSIVIGAIDAAGVNIPSQSLGLDGYAGEHVHIWLDADGSYSLDREKDHYWHVAELDVPARQYQEADMGEVDTDGQPIVRPVPLPVDLSQSAIASYDLPDRGYL